MPDEFRVPVSPFRPVPAGADQGDWLAQINRELGRQLAARPSQLSSLNPDEAEAIREWQADFRARLASFPEPATDWNREERFAFRKGVFNAHAQLDEAAADRLAELATYVPGDDRVRSYGQRIEELVQEDGSPRAETIEEFKAANREHFRAQLARFYAQAAEDWSEGRSDVHPVAKSNAWIRAQADRLDAAHLRATEQPFLDRSALDPRNVMRGLGEQVRSVAELRNPVGPGGILRGVPATDRVNLPRPVARFAERFGADIDTAEPPASFFHQVDAQGNVREPEPFTAAAELGGSLAGELALFAATDGTLRAIPELGASTRARFGLARGGFNAGRHGLPVFTREVGGIAKAAEFLRPDNLARRGAAGSIAAALVRDVPAVTLGGASGRGLRSEEFFGPGGALDPREIAFDVASSALEAGFAQAADELAPALASTAFAKPTTQQVARIRERFGAALRHLPEDHAVHAGLRQIAKASLADAPAAARARIAAGSAGFISGFALEQARGGSEEEAILAGFFFATLSQRHRDPRSAGEMLDGLDEARRMMVNRGEPHIPGHFPAGKTVHSAREEALAAAYDQALLDAMPVLELHRRPKLPSNPDEWAFVQRRREMRERASLFQKTQQPREEIEEGFRRLRGAFGLPETLPQAPRRAATADFDQLARMAAPSPELANSFQAYQRDLAEGKLGRTPRNEVELQSAFIGQLIDRAVKGTAAPEELAWLRGRGIDPRAPRR